MKVVFAFFAERRKAMGYIVAALAEYVTQLLPQANPANAQVLHGIVLALGFLLVYLPENDKKPDVATFLDELVRGDDAPSRHAAPPAAPVPVAPPAPPVVVPPVVIPGDPAPAVGLG